VPDTTPSTPVAPHPRRTSRSDLAIRPAAAQARVSERCARHQLRSTSKERAPPQPFPVVFGSGRVDGGGPWVCESLAGCSRATTLPFPSRYIEDRERSQLAPRVHTWCHAHQRLVCKLDSGAVGAAVLSRNHHPHSTSRSQTTRRDRHPLTLRVQQTTTTMVRYCGYVSPLCAWPGSLDALYPAWSDRRSRQNTADSNTAGYR
jgi:hypothetical protein